MSDPFCLSWPLHSRYLEGSTSQVYSSGFYFRISWILMEWLYFSQNQTLTFLKGLRSLQNWLTQKLSMYLWKNKVQPSIFMNLWSRNHLNKFDWLTPQELYCCCCSTPAWRRLRHSLLACSTRSLEIQVKPDVITMHTM